MTLLDDLLPASFRGTPFLLDVTTTSGGRKTVTNEFPNSNRRFVEDLGLLNKSFAISGTITGPNYAFKRDALIVALEKKGAGILIINTLGVFNVVSTTYTLSERMTALGDATFTMNFEVAQDSLVPTPIQGALSNIFSSVLEAIALIETTVIQAISITRSDNFVDALSKVDSFLQTMGGLTNVFVTESDTFDEFSKELTAFADNSSQILTNTVLLGSAISGLFTTLDSSLATPQDGVNLFEDLYTFGDTDTDLDIDTFALNEKNANRDRLNGAYETLALLMNYRNVPQLDFLTVTDINNQREALDAQFEKINSNPAIADSDKSSLLMARNEVRQFLDRESLRAFKITDFDTKDTTITELTYRLYGNLDNLQALIDLNNFKDIQHIEGTVQVLSK